MNEKKALAEAIRRIWEGKTATRLAQKAGIKKSTLSEYMNAKRFPRKKNFKAVAAGLGCTPEQLEEVMWQIRTENRPGAIGHVLPQADETAAAKLRELLGNKISDARQAADPRLRSILEDVSASAFHAQAAQDRYAAAWTKLIDYLADDTDGPALTPADA